MVILHNLQRRPLVANLPHAEWCARSGTCTCRPVDRQVLEVNAASGVKSFRSVRKLIPYGFSLPAFGVSAPMHSSIVLVPEIQRAILEGRVRAEVVPEQKAPEQHTDTPTED